MLDQWAGSAVLRVKRWNETGRVALALVGHISFWTGGWDVAERFVPGLPWNRQADTPFAFWALLLYAFGGAILLLLLGTLWTTSGVVAPTPEKRMPRKVSLWRAKDIVIVGAWSTVSGFILIFVWVGCYDLVWFFVGKNCGSNTLQCSDVKGAITFSCGLCLLILSGTLRANACTQDQSNAIGFGSGRLRYLALLVQAASSLVGINTCWVGTSIFSSQIGAEGPLRGVLYMGIGYCGMLVMGAIDRQSGAWAVGQTWQVDLIGKRLPDRQNVAARAALYARDIIALVSYLVYWNGQEELLYSFHPKETFGRAVAYLCCGLALMLCSNAMFFYAAVTEDEGHRDSTVPASEDDSMSKLTPGQSV